MSATTSTVVTDEKKVGVRCTVVPDGVAANSGTQVTIRVSVVLTPVIQPADYVGGANVSLANWVNDLSDGGQCGIRLFHRAKAGDEPTELKPPLGPVPWHSDPQLTGSTSREQGAKTQAQALWQRLFAGNDGKFTGLYEAIKDENANASATRASYQSDRAESLRVRIGGVGVDPGRTKLLGSARLTEVLEETRFKALETRLESKDPMRTSSAQMGRVTSNVLDAIFGPATNGARFTGPAGLLGTLEKSRTDKSSSSTGLHHLVENILNDKPASGLGRVTRNESRQLVEDFFTPGRKPKLETIQRLREAVTTLRATLDKKTAVPARSDDPKDPRNVARRRLAALEAHPTVGKFLRTIHDFEITLPASELLPVGTEVRCGEITATLAMNSARMPAPPAQATWTAFILERSSDHSNGWRFDPASRLDACVADRLDSPNGQVPLKNGFVALKTANRFSLAVVDPVASAMSAMDHQEAQEQSRDSGTTESLDPLKPSTLRSYGLQVQDHLADAEITSSLAFTARRHFFAAKPDESAKSPDLLYAEDLVSGYRVDVERTTLGVGSAWSTLTSCDRLYKDLYDAYKEMYPSFTTASQWHPFVGQSDPKSRHFRDRDDGYVGSSGAFETEEDGDENEFFAVTQEALVTWPGDSLGVPGEQLEYRAKKVEALKLDPDYDFAVWQEYRLPQEEERFPTVLREGDLYRVCLRPRYINGGSRPFRASDPRRDAHALGDPNHKPYAFRRPEEIHGPQVLLLPSDDLLNPSKPEPGTQADILVLRSEDPVGKETTDYVERILVPPNCPQDRAEQQGWLDNLGGDIPPGAFLNVLMLQNSASFPPARRSQKDTAGRGLLFQTGGRQSGRTEHYYPDANARMLAIGFYRQDSPAPGFSESRGGYEFWKPDQLPGAAKGISLQVVANPALKQGGTAAPQLGEDNLQVRAVAGSLRVDLAPAEEVELRLWCHADDIQMSRSNLFISRALSNLRGLGRSKLLGPVGIHPFPEVFASTKLKLVHAVAKPRRAPRWSANNVPKITLLTNIEDWKGKVDDCRAGGNIAFFSGHLNFDRRSTLEVRCEATWLEFENPSAIQRNANGEWQFVPPRRTVELFSVKNLTAYLEQGDGDILDLVRDETGDLRKLSYPFDRRARLLTLRLIGTSRFASYFTPNPKYGADRFERANFASTDITLQRMKDEEASPNGLTVWLPATERPPAPEFETPEVVLREQKLSTKGAYPIVVRKTASTVRITFRPNTWFASGQGELLAVLCLPANLVDEFPSNYPKSGHVDLVRRVGHTLDKDEQVRSGELQRLTVPGLTAVAPAIRHVITAWGTNPTYESGEMPVAIPPSAFSGYVRKIPDFNYVFRLPSEFDQPSAEIPLKVSLVLYQAQLDRKTGEYYVEIELEPGPVDTPFVRLCLARYQQHAIPDHNLSPHKTVDAQGIHPPRTVEVNVDGAKIDVKVAGPGYHLRAPFDVDVTKVPPRLLSLADTPLQNFTLRRRVETRGSVKGMVQHFNEDGPLIVSRVPGVADAAGKSWTARFILSESAEVKDLRLSIHETELNLPLRVEKMPANGNELNPFVETPRLFACDIEL